MKINNAISAAKPTKGIIGKNDYTGNYRPDREDIFQARLKAYRDGTLNRPRKKTAKAKRTPKK